MKRISTTIGDIFSVEINDRNKKYFQLIAYDSTQLNSDVIRAFKTIYSIEAEPMASEVVNDEIDFYAHCVTKWGVKMGLWKKVGNIKEIGRLDHILFKGTSDYGLKKGEHPVKVSDKWYIWKIGDQEFTKVGKLEDENRKAEIGLIMNPYDIVDRIQTGKYKGSYPNFE